MLCGRVKGQQQPEMKGKGIAQRVTRNYYKPIISGKLNWYKNKQNDK